VASFDRFSIVSYSSSLVTLSLKCIVLDILDLQNAMTMNTGLLVHQGNWKCYRAAECISICSDFV